MIKVFTPPEAETLVCYGNKGGGVLFEMRGLIAAAANVGTRRLHRDGTVVISHGIALDRPQLHSLNGRPV